MAKVFKITITSYRDPKGKKCPKSEAVSVDADGKKVLRPGYQRFTTLSEKYYGRVPSAQGKVCRVPLCGDKAAAKQILAQKLADATKARHGLGDPYAKHRARPLTEHLADFRRELEARGNTLTYVELVCSRITAALEGCEFKFLDDLSASRVTEWLSDFRSKGRDRTYLPSGQESYTIREVAAVLAVKPPAIRAIVRRHHLEASGNGKARRFPRATVEALQEHLCRGVSVQTSNYYLTHLKSFGWWMRKNRRVAENPFDHLERVKNTDLRHRRRELTAEELQRLMAGTGASSRAFRGLAGTDRYALYATACGTGFRAAALASLRPENFSLETDPATVTLAGRHNKSRKTRIQPLPPDIADVLRQYLPTTPAGQVLWGGTWASDHRGAEMLRGDLADANIPYVTHDPDGPLYADFHALRHTYLTLLGKGGVELRTAMELADHSTPVLTARYSHRRLNDLAQAVQKLPRFLPEKAEDTKDCQKKDSHEGGSPVCRGLAGTGAGQVQDESVQGSRDHGEKTNPETTKPPVPQGFSHGQAVPVSSVQKRGRRDSNPQPPDRQFAIRLCNPTLPDSRHALGTSSKALPSTARPVVSRRLGTAHMG
jgi:integrase/recombinase XerC